MVTRRNFLGMLAVLPALTALAGSGLRLPKKVETEIEVEGGQYLASKDSWYIQTDLPNGFRNTVAAGAELTEKSFDDMLDAMRYSMADYKVRPTKLIVHPDMVERAKYVLSHRAGLIERLWWWLNPHVYG